MQYTTIFLKFGVSTVLLLSRKYKIEFFQDTSFKERKKMAVEINS